MPQERVQRRLAAILAADVVGYSRLMARDEGGTHARLKALRAEIFDPKTTQFGGRIFKNTGDGALAEFPSAVDAALAAIEVQSGLSTYNQTLPDDQRIAIRIGISLGDVIVDDDDLYGNGVNIAARMESLAKPGGICISASVYEHLLAAMDLGFEDLGEQTVKNIDRPVHAYSISISQSESTPPAKSQLDRAFHRPAVAVLPFDNLSGDPEQEYFSDGLTEDIITALSLWRTFPVIARNSTFTYKGNPAKVQDIGRELGARYVIEGSVRKGGDRVRITVQLIDAETGHHVWAERYDRELHDIFDLQDEITERIATTVEPELERAERQRAILKPPTDPMAWDYYLRGAAQLFEFTKEGNEEARALFRQALALDPTYSRCWAGISYSHYRDVFLALADDRQRSVADSLESAQKAVALDETDSHAHFALSRALHLAGRLNEAVREARLSVQLNPNDALSHASLGIALVSADQPDSGIAAVQRALSLSPQDPRAHFFLGFQSCGQFVAGRYGEASVLAQDAANRRPGDFAAQLLLYVNLAADGKTAEAKTAFANGPTINGNLLEHCWAYYWLPERCRSQFVEFLQVAGWTR